MALPENINTLEKQKFSEVNDKVVVDVNNLAGIGLSPYDSIGVSYPDETTEIYTYKLDAVITNTITVTYVSSCKTELETLVKT